MEIKPFLLSEAAKTIIALKDAPEWVKAVFKQEGTSFSSIEVEASPEPTIGHQWHDADVIKAYFYVDGKVVKQNSASYETFLVANDKERALMNGVKVKLWDEPVPGKPNMVLVTHSYPKRAELFAHPNQMPKSIEDTGSGNLTDGEIKVLLITKMYVSSSRKEYLRSYRVKDYEAVKASLIKKGLMTAAGALNVKGKNTVEKLREEGSLEERFGYGS